MAVRKKPRIKMVAPIRMWGTDSAGKPFNVLAYTLNVSNSGARIGGVKVSVAVGEAVTLQYKQNKALFKVVWLGQPGNPTNEQIGVTLLEQDRPIWGEIEDPATFIDDFRGTRAEPKVEAAPVPPVFSPAASSQLPANGNSSDAVPVIPDVLPPVPADGAPIDTNELLKRSAEGLLKIDAFVKANPPGPGSLQEFRDAVARVRQTMWALQQWHEVKAEGKKAFPLLSYLNAERARFIERAMKDMADDIEHKGVEVEGTLLQRVFARVEQLRSVQVTPFALEVVPPNAGAKASVAFEVQVAVRAAMTDALRSGMSEADSMRYLARELQREMRADGVALARLEGEEMICVGSSGNAPDTGMVLETETGIGGEAVHNRELVYCADTQSDARVDAELCRAANIGAVAMVPIVSTMNEPVGMVQISTARPRPFDEDHLAALGSAAKLLQDVVVAKNTARTA